MLIENMTKKCRIFATNFKTNHFTRQTMKKTIAIAIAAFCCITANAQEINAVVTRQGTTNKNCYQLSSQPSVVFDEDNTITVKEGETAKEQYTLSGSNTLTVLFGSVLVHLYAVKRQLC